MKIPKLSRKAIVIICSLIGVLLFTGITILLYPQLTYIASKVETVINNVADKDKTEEEDLNADSDTDTKEPSSLGGYEENIVFESDDAYDLVLNPNGHLTKVTPPVSIFVKSDSSKDIYDPDERVTCYEAGTISGTLKSEGQTITVKSGTKYYAASFMVYNSPSVLFGPYETEGWFPFGGIVRYFINDGKVYIINDDDFFSAATISGIGEIAEIVPDTNKDDDMDDSYEIHEKSILEKNVVVLAPDVRNPIDDSTYSIKVSSDDPAVFSYYFFTSTKGGEFIFYDYNISVTPAQSLSGYTEVDSYNGLKIYQNSKKGFRIVDREGFLQEISYEAPFSSSEEVTFNWLDGTTSSGTYFSSYGTCESMNDATEGYVFEDVPESELKKIGVAENTDLYEKKSFATDAFTKKMYKEDYLGSEYWKYNEISDDDAKALTYDEYLSYHPVIYVKDIYGEYIRYTNSDFFAVGGCAKPAIYLYPQKTTEISVKVIPNGKLTFTYPKYGNGWNVVAYKDGKIVNKADGRTYNYLWWDSYTYKLNVPAKGFVIEKSQIAEFLNEKLSAMNLNESEKAEFKAYWIPKIQYEDSEYIFVTFLFNDEVNQVAKLEVDPKPESSFRVFMLYKPVDDGYFAEPLDLKNVSRTGYMLVEWGGAKL